MILILEASINYSDKVKHISSYSFDSEGGKIGYASTCHLILDDPLCKISNIQAEIKYKNDDFYIYNLGHRSSIFINGNVLFPGDNSLINDNSIFLIGKYSIKVKIKNNKISEDSFDKQINQVDSKTEQKNIDIIKYDEAIPFSDLITPQINFDPIENNSIIFSKENDSLPDDFNPMSLPTESSKNSEDPLLELKKENIKELIKNESFDSIFNKDNEEYDDSFSLDSFLNKKEKLEEFNISLDPLDLIRNNESNSFIRTDESFNKKILKDNSAEIHSYFKAPKAYIQEKNDNKENTSSLEELFDIKNEKKPNSTKEFEIAKANINHSTNFNKNNSTNNGINDKLYDNNIEIIDKTKKELSDQLNSLSEYGSNLIEETNEEISSDLTDEIDFDLVKKTDHQLINNCKSNAEDLLQSFKKGAKLENCRYPENLTPELMYLIGSMLESSIQGCMELLQSRAMTKQEIRIPITLISAEKNNPLKCLPTGGSALAQIFGPNMPGFESGVQSIENSFNDLKIHEIAMWAATQSSINALLKLFSPKNIEKDIKSNSKLNFNRNSKLWEIYCSRYEKLIEEIKNHTPKYWEDNFRKAYTSEVLKVKDNSL